MSELLVATGVAAAVGLPHLLRLDRIVPATAIAIWTAALLLRASLAIGAALFIVIYVPQTPVFSAIANWCWDLLTHHVEFSPHPLAHAALFLPALALGASLLWGVGNLVRAARRLERHLRRRTIGRGPLNSTVLADAEPMIALTGFGRARLLVSRGALELLDSDEIEAGLAHELGHSRRWHRPLLTVATLCTAIARPLPGTQSALGGLRLALERDADVFAVARTGDALALASAICKVGEALAIAPTARGFTDAAVALGGSGDVAPRLDYLLGDVVPRGRVTQALARMVAASMVLVVLALALTVPQWAIAAPFPQDAGGSVLCDGH